MIKRHDIFAGHQKPRRGKLSTLLMAALAGMVFLVVLLSVVVAVLGPGMAAAIIAFVGGLSVLVLLHYVTWGWWLGGMIRRDVEADEASDAANAALADSSATADGASSDSTPSKPTE